MSAVFRAPTINRLQPLLTTRTLPSPSPSSHRSLLPRQTTSLFSTSRAVRTKTNTGGNTKSSISGDATTSANTNANRNPSYPKFDLRSIVPNPRVRKALIAAFGVMAAMEAWMWITYWPRIAGWWQGEAEVGAGIDGKKGTE